MKAPPVKSSPKRVSKKSRAVSKLGQTQTVSPLSVPAACPCDGGCPTCSAVTEALNSGTQSLAEPGRSFFQSRFQQDFSRVRVHTGPKAEKAARSLNAQAYTIGNDIVFGKGTYSPGSLEGKKLLAHELTHVIQQKGKSARHIQKKKTPRAAKKLPYYYDLLKEHKKDKAAGDTGNHGPAQRKAFLRVILAIKQAEAKPGNAALLTRVKKAVTVFQKSMKKYGPQCSRLDWMLNSCKYKDGILNILILVFKVSARLELLGLKKESVILKKYNKLPSGRLFTIAPNNYSTLLTAALDRLSETAAGLGPTAAYPLIAVYKMVLRPLEKLNYLHIKADAKLAEQVSMPKPRSLDTPFSVFEFRFGKMLAYYLFFEQMRIRIFMALNRFVRLQMDKAIVELETTNKSDTLKKLEPVINNILDALSIRVKTIDNERIRHGRVDIPITRSDFKGRRKYHLDFYGQKRPRSAARIKIKFFDKTRKTGEEIKQELNRVYLKFKAQIGFLKQLYGLKTKDRTLRKEGIVNAGLIRKHLPGGKFRLHSNDDWRKLLEAKYNLLKKKGINKPEAFLRIIVFLRKYLRAFTLHTPYDVYDKRGRNYLTRAYPRALTGQLIHDCGIYALRIVYMLSLLSKKLGLKFRLVQLPLHVGLLITGNNIPTLVVHNNSFFPYPHSSRQIKQLSKKSRQALKYREHKNQIIPLNKLKKMWENYWIKKYVVSKLELLASIPYFSGSTAVALLIELINQPDFQFDSPIRGAILKKLFGNKKNAGAQFMAELSAATYIPHVSMPVRLVNIPSWVYSPRRSKRSIKRLLWWKYRQLWVKNKKQKQLFKSIIKNRSSRYYQFALRYLKLVKDYKKFHNSVLRPTWNVHFYRTWGKHGPGLKQVLSSNDSTLYRVRKNAYLNQLNKKGEKMRSEFMDLLKRKREISKLLARKRRILVPARIRIVSVPGSYIIFGDYKWDFDYVTHVRNIKEGKDIIPPFATPAGFLKLIE